MEAFSNLHSILLEFNGKKRMFIATILILLSNVPIDKILLSGSIIYILHEEKLVQGIYFTIIFSLLGGNYVN